MALRYATPDELDLSKMTKVEFKTAEEREEAFRGFTADDHALVSYASYPVNGTPDMNLMRDDKGLVLVAKRRLEVAYLGIKPDCDFLRTRSNVGLMICMVGDKNVDVNEYEVQTYMESMQGKHVMHVYENDKIPGCPENHVIAVAYVPNPQNVRSGTATKVTQWRIRIVTKHALPWVSKWYSTATMPAFVPNAELAVFKQIANGLSDGSIRGSDKSFGTKIHMQFAKIRVNWDFQDWESAFRSNFTFWVLGPAQILIAEHEETKKKYFVGYLDPRSTKLPSRQHIWNNLQCDQEDPTPIFMDMNPRNGKSEYGDVRNRYEVCVHMLQTRAFYNRIGADSLESVEITICNEKELEAKLQTKKRGKKLKQLTTKKTPPGNTYIVFPHSYIRLADVPFVRRAKLGVFPMVHLEGSTVLTLDDWLQENPKPKPMRAACKRDLPSFERKQKNPKRAMVVNDLVDFLNC